MTGKHGFTLIELSIVLVIIGLIVGGILVGQELVQAAELRATVAQLEKYNTSINTFRAKYGFIPGDIPAAKTAQLGFYTETVNGGEIGHQDGNGFVEDDGSIFSLEITGQGEVLGFWRHLTDADMIDGNFGTAEAGNALDPATGTVAAALTPGNAGSIFPKMKLGRGNHLLTYAYEGTNYFMITGISSMTTGGDFQLNQTITPIEAQNIDRKIDDGLASHGSTQGQQERFMPGGPAAVWIPPSPRCLSVSEYAVTEARPCCQLVIQFK